MARRATWVLGLGLMAGGAAADTLVLRSGQRLEGELVEYRGDRLEWRTDRGRLERFDRSDVRRIEFEGFPGRDEPAFTSGRPAGLREREISVAAASAWTPTGVEVERGQRLYFEARGQVHWGPDRKDGPDGERSSNRNPGRPIPGRNGAALIGRIGEGDPFFIGAETGAIRVRDSGPLLLGINDDYLQDNSGAFRVTVYY